MNKPAEPNFSTRRTVTLELPLSNGTQILHPEQIILKIGARYQDLGAFCYAQRSEMSRRAGQPRMVVLGSFIKQRPKQILQLIKAISRLSTDGGLAQLTVCSRLELFKMFLDWADAKGRLDCLSGGDATRHAYLAWAEELRERYRRQELGEAAHNYRLVYIREFLEATTGLEGLHRGTRRIKIIENPSCGTEPLTPHNFAHAVALSQALFDGLCDIVLEQKPFPYKLILPSTLGWTENHLWLFPTNRWCLSPREWGVEREKLDQPHWAYDYANGRLANIDEIMHRYRELTPGRQRARAMGCLAGAQAGLYAANVDARKRVRIMLGMIAHNAFLFLFACNTGANESVMREIETDGKIGAATLNQQYRSIKFRAGNKPITLIVPTSLMPSLRRFMDLRTYLLNGKSCPYLFFTLGSKYEKPPAQISYKPLESLAENQLRYIDPLLPRLGPRKLRASVADWYQRHHDASVTAKVLQNSEQIARKRYDSGSVTDHHEEMSLFLISVSESAKRQRVIPIMEAAHAKPLEEGGRCDSFGHPAVLADGVPFKPNCKDSQGCLFCAHRVLVACEEDVRKVASAAFVMEQLIMGPKHEETLRPLIAKCDEDLEKIAAFGNCRAMVQRVRDDVFQNSNLTHFFADKYQLFLELGVIA